MKVPQEMKGCSRREALFSAIKLALIIKAFINESILLINKK